MFIFEPELQLPHTEQTILMQTPKWRWHEGTKGSDTFSYTHHKPLSEDAS